MEVKQNNIIIKRILLAVMLVALVLPMVQHKFKWINVKGLNGAIEEEERPVLSVENWFNGTYQDQQTDYLNQNVGFRSDMVRTYNQWHFSLYNQARANGVVIGKENYLYEQNYINAYYGDDFVGGKVIQEQVRKLKMVSDTLEKLGKHLVVMLAPGKASFFSEYLPNKDLLKFDKVKNSNLNLQHYAKTLSQMHVKTINLNSWFIQQKGKMKHPLFPKTGIHWSKYGEVVMADTLISFLNQLKGVDLPKLVVDSFNVTDDAWDTDDDIEKGMNLMYDIPDNVMGYPYFHIEKDSTKKYAKVLTIADSYFWGPFNWGMSRDLFSEGQFWYYNEAIYPDSYEKPLFVKDVNLKNRIEENEVILILVTDANLFKFGFGFVEQAYETYFKKK